MSIKRKLDMFLWKKFGLQQVIISPICFVLHKIKGGYEGICIFGMEFDKVIYWVTIDDGEKSYEYSYPEVFKVKHKLIGEILFENDVFSAHNDGDVSMLWQWRRGTADSIH